MNKFSNQEIKELGHYVYIYSHPNTGEVFYVGKGHRNRVFDHIHDEKESEKTKYINELDRQQLKPKIEILIHGLKDSDTALRIESSVIDLLGINNLTNIQKGYKSASHGRMTIDQLKSTYSKKQIKITEPAILIRINKAFRYSMSAMELYDYTRGHWVVNPDNAKLAKYAFSIYDGVIQEVYEIAGWFKAGTTYSVREEGSTEETEWRKPEVVDEKRFEFVGNLAPQEMRSKYNLKSLEEGIFKKGNSNPILYLNIK